MRNLFAIPMPKESNLPFQVTQFTNPRTGTVSYRVSGSHETLGRIRKNFADPAAAEMFLSAKNAEALGIVTQPLNFAQTRLTQREIAAAESGITRAAGRYSLEEILAAGLDKLTARKETQTLLPLFLEFEPLIRKEVGPRFSRQVRETCTEFLRAHKDITTDEFGRATIRKWLDSADVATQTKRNRRSALSRFGQWLQQRLDLATNPVSGIKLSASRHEKGRGAPAVFSAKQAQAWMWAVQQPSCSLIKGWAALCLFGGLRPASEAIHLSAGEIKLEKREINVMGTKRGAKPRVLPMNDALHAWLVNVMVEDRGSWPGRAPSDRNALPGYFSRKHYLRAVEMANAWLATNAPGEKPIVWQGDIQRHTYASMRASTGISVSDLVKEMGTSERTYYAHYKNPRPSAEVKAFWSIRPLAS